MSDQDPADRLDPSVRELTFRLMEMAPDAPPFPEEVPAMTAPVRKQRPPMLVWAAAAVAAVLLVGLPLFLFRGGDEPIDPVTTIAAPDTTTTTTTVVDEPTATTSDTTEMAATPAESLTSGDCKADWEALEERSVEAWYVFYGCDRPGMENVLVPVARSQITNVSSDMRSAMLAQLEGPSQVLRDAGYHAFSVEDGEPSQIVLAFDGPTDVVFDFDDFRSDSGMANASASTASTYLLAELSSVLFQFPDVETVTFSINGSCDQFWNWLQRDCRIITRADWAASELTSPLAYWWDSAQELVPTTTIPPVSTTTTTFPGEAFDIGPLAGDVVAVVGVAHDDTLNLREGPSVDYVTFIKLDPLADDLVATGRHRLLPGSIWTEVTGSGMTAEGNTVGGITGWVNSSYLGYLGGVDDLTSQVVSQMGAIPEAETMLDLGTVIAESFDPGEGGFRNEMVIPPTVGNLGEVTFDVVGLLDDAQLGWRLHIFGQPTSGGEGFSLASVEATAFCGRGVTADGLCI